MTVKEMREKKKEMGLSNREVAERSGVSIGTVQKVFSGETEVPRYRTLVKLIRAFQEEIGWSPETHDANASGNMIPSHESKKKNYVSAEDNVQVAEPAYAYNAAVKKQKKGIPIHTDIQKGIGPYTIADHEAMPEDVRAELIDGHFYDMSGPTTIHQQLVLEIVYRFREYVKKNKGNCFPFIAPLDVQLDRDDKTNLEPDVFVVCDRDQITKKGIVGAPDLVIEVLSPGSWQRDLVLKLRKYREAGVREYWVILPDQKMVYVYEFKEKADPEIYTFSDKVPVGIWDKKCRIDFAEIFEEIRFLYE